MQRHAEGVTTFEAPQRFLGIEMGARMTVLDTGNGLLVHSPIDVAPEVVEPLGKVRWVVAPNKFHHLYVGEWMDAGIEGWAAPGLAEKRPDLQFAGVLGETPAPFGDSIGVVALRCFGFTQEVVLLHRPSKTLVVTDLLFNIQPEAPLMTRAFMTVAGGYPGCCTTLLERWGFDRTVAKKEMANLASLDFDRLVMAHGAVVETGGKEAFVKAMAWLGI